jgi:hypothetical protein
MIDLIFNHMTRMTVTPLAIFGIYLSVPLFVLGATILVSFISIKIGSVGLRMTGLEPRVASFQALSAFTGTGFTTRESEKIAAHAGRRKIVQILIVSGNVGLATAIVTAVQAFRSFEGSGDSEKMLGNALVLLAVGAIVYYFAVVKRLNRWLDRIIEKRLERFTDLELVDFEEVLKLSADTGIAKIDIHEGNPVLGKALKDLGLSNAGLLILAIERKSKLLPAPAAGTIIELNDSIVCYGASKLARSVAHGEFVPPENANTLVVAGDRLVCYGPSEAVRGLADAADEQVGVDSDVGMSNALTDDVAEAGQETRNTEMTA